MNIRIKNINTNTKKINSKTVEGEQKEKIDNFKPFVAHKLAKVEENVEQVSGARFERKGVMDNELAVENRGIEPKKELGNTGKVEAVKPQFLQAYFHAQQGLKSFSPEHLIAVSKENFQPFHKVPLSELANFIRDFSIELLPEGEKMARLSLEPPELGRLELEVKVKDKKVEVVARVEKPEVLHEIRQRLHQIKTHFEEAGLQLKDFQLSLAENLAGGGELFAEKRGEERSSGRERRQKTVEVAGIEGESRESSPLVNLKGSHYYIA
jgi:flagellar hook-length control protein FliK